MGFQISEGYRYAVPLNGNSYSVITARKRSLGQGNIFRSVCEEFCPRGGVCLSACWDTTPPPRPGTPQNQAPLDQEPPQEQTPPGPAPLGPGTPLLEQTPHPPGVDTHPPPPERSMLGDTVNERAVRILLECNLVLLCAQKKL